MWRDIDALGGEKGIRKVTEPTSRTWCISRQPLDRLIWAGGVFDKCILKFTWKKNVIIVKQVKVVPY